jgi:two-component system sensor histidine kinase AgrC
MTNNTYDLKKYYNKIMPEAFKINNLYRFHSKLLGNSAIYGVVSDKYNLAETKDIKMSLNILLDLNLLNIDTYTITRILGILLDNAIEAASECSQKVVNLSFQELDEKQMIIVENTYLSKKISINKIFEKNFTTKKENSGLGLWEISKLINKNKNLKLSTYANPDYFLQKLEIS